MSSLVYGGGKPDDGAAAGRPQYLSTTTLHKHCKHQGPSEPEVLEAPPAPKILEANGRLIFEDDLRSGGLLCFTKQ